LCNHCRTGTAFRRVRLGPAVSGPAGLREQHLDLANGGFSSYPLPPQNFGWRSTTKTGVPSNAISLRRRPRIGDSTRLLPHAGMLHPRWDATASVFPRQRIGRVHGGNSLRVHCDRETRPPASSRRNRMSGLDLETTRQNTRRASIAPTKTEFVQAELVFDPNPGFGQKLGCARSAQTSFFVSCRQRPLISRRVARR